MNKAETKLDLPGLLQDFFCKRLIQQQHVSDHTVKSYRDTFRLFLRFAEKRTGKSVIDLDLVDLDADLTLAFLNHLEVQRRNSVRSRNARLAAIRSFVHYAALQRPAAISEIRRISAIPMKRFDRPSVGFLSRSEVEALLSAPNVGTWSGRRDHVLLTTLYNTGARVSEIVGIRRMDVEDERCAAVHLHGKGRKERVVPLWKKTTKLLRSWLSNIAGDPQKPIFPNRLGHPMTRSGLEKRLRAAASIAQQSCPSLRNKRISPHVLRHTTAMHLLQSGVDLAVIALWLGHESIETTHGYLQADIKIKEQALARLQEPKATALRYKASKDILAFLDSL
jgi:site-specific recombinase XerD